MVDKRHKTLCTYSLCLVVTLLTSCGSSPSKTRALQTGEKVYFNDTVPYREEKSIRPAVVSECKIQKNVVDALHAQSESDGLALSSESQRRTLTLEIMGATPGIFIFGNFGSVPATLDVGYKLTEGDKTLLEGIEHCETKLAGFLGLQPSACNKLEKCARHLGELISERVSALPR